MRYRYLLGGAAVATIAGMAIGLGVLGGQNIDKTRQLDQKRQELALKEGTVPPPESRTLRGPSLPAYPSPGYEN